MEKSICQIVREMEENYINGNTTISKYVDFNMYENLNKIDAYLNSVHISGPVDSLGREKPFFNIVTAVRNIWFRATDIDRKNLKLKATKSNQYVSAFVAQMLLTNWMKKAKFGAYLNQWGLTLATYCSAVSKFVEKNGELFISVIPWNRIICDPIDFKNNVVIEVLEFTPAQLKQQNYDKEAVEALLQTLAPREDLDKQKKDNKADYIKVYEVHGELPLSLLTENEDDEDTYVQQTHIVSFVGEKSRGRRGIEYEDFTLFKGREKKNPYHISHLLKEDGRTLGIGSVESLFEAQWMVNHSAKLIKDTLDLTSLLILQTSDQAFVGKNALSSLVTGDIQVHTENNPLTQINTQHDITQIQNFSAQWQELAKEITATPDAIRGNTQPSGTAYRLQQLITNESHSLFEIMTENKGLAIEEMLREYIIPHLKTKLDTTDEVSAILSSEGITQFDSMYVPNEAIRRNNEAIKQQVLSGEIAYNSDLPSLENGIKKELSVLGNQRFVKPDDVTWKQALKDFEWEVEADITHESEDVNEALTSLSSTFQTIASLAGRPMTPDEKLVFNKIMEKSGVVSPLELSQSPPSIQPTGGGRLNSESQTINQPAMAMG